VERNGFIDEEVGQAVIDAVEELAGATGKPVGVVTVMFGDGSQTFWATQYFE